MSYHSDRNREVIEGLTILSKYEGAYTAAEHDILYAGPESPEDVSSEDTKRLKEINWHFDDEVDSWACFT